MRERGTAGALHVVGMCLVSAAVLSFLAAPASAERADPEAAAVQSAWASPEQCSFTRMPLSLDLVLISSLDAEGELVSGGEPELEPEHNPAAMLLLSMAVPGAGQLAQGQKRGYLYLLAELALWGGFYALDQQGLDVRSDYEQFADNNWDYAAYLEWYDVYCDCDEPIGDYDCRPMATYGSQEFYEDIGKYATYWRWWNVDGDENDPDFVWSDYSDADVAVRDSYWDMRIESNKHLKRARYLMAAALLNHIVSAVDSFVSARAPVGSAGSSSDVGLEFDATDSGDGLTCAFVARY